jgi:hypothetical protein
MRGQLVPGEQSLQSGAVLTNLVSHSANCLALSSGGWGAVNITYVNRVCGGPPQSLPEGSVPCAHVPTSGKRLPLSKVVSQIAGKDLTLSKVVSQIAGEDLTLSKVVSQRAGEDLTLSKVVSQIAGEDLTLSKVVSQIAGEDLTLSNGHFMFHCIDLHLLYN